jgi:hypothetical protein
MAQRLALLASLPVLRAETVQLFQWRNVNIQGMGYVTGLVVQPAAPFDVYIRTDVGGAYRFDRPSSSWIPLLDGLATQGGIGTESVAIDPGAPARAYVVIPRTNSIVANEYQYTGEVMVSEDRGVTWRGTGLAQYGIYIAAPMTTTVSNPASVWRSTPTTRACSTSHRAATDCGRACASPARNIFGPRFRSRRGR